MKNFTLPYTGKTKATDILKILFITLFIGSIFYFLKSAYFDNSFQEGFSGPDNIVKHGYIPDARVNDIIEVRLPNSDMGLGSKRERLGRRDIIIYNTRTRKSYKVRGKAVKGEAGHYNRLMLPIPHGLYAKFDADHLNKAHQWGHGLKHHPKGKGWAYLPHNAGNQNDFRFNLRSGRNQMFIERVAAPGGASSRNWNGEKDGSGRIYPKFSAGWQNKYNFRYQIRRLNPEPPKPPDPKIKKLETERDGYQRQRDSANKKLGIIYGDISRVPPGFDKLKNIPALEKQITDLENKRDKIKKKKDEYINLYDKAQKRINNPIDGDPRGLLAQIAQLKGTGAAAKSQYEKNKAAAEARRLAELKAKEEEKKAAAEASKIRLAEEALETESALEQARKAKAQAEAERREYMNLRRRLEARIKQLNSQQGQSNEELYAALAKINELKQEELELRANMKERINRERANAVANERSIMEKTYERRINNRVRRFIRRFNLEEERKRQETVKKQRDKTQELLGLRRQYLRQYTMDIHNKEKLEKEENMLKQVRTSQDTIQTMNKRDTPEDGVEPSTTGYSSSQPQILNGSVGNQQNVGVSRIGENRRKQFGVHQSNVYLTVPKDSENKDDVEVGRKTIGGNIIPSLD